MPSPSTEALFRYQVVSQVLSRMLAGERRRAAVQRTAALEHQTFGGERRRVSLRTLYRWTKVFEEHGIAGLEPRRTSPQVPSEALPEGLLDYIAKEKEDDPKDSIPELIRRAREMGIIPRDVRVDRTTVYRQLLRRGAPVRRRKTAGQRDARRFAYPHRMDMVLCDGKHFRAGPAHAKRVALFFLDDATRYALHVVVGPSESTDLFLRGLYEAIGLFGVMSIVYLDHGPGFIAQDTATTVRNLDALLIHGEVSYPEGHGKIERFNQTAKAGVLRGLAGRPDVDPRCGALEVRLRHYLREVYAHLPHESLGGQTPAERFLADSRPLRFPKSDADLRRCFVAYEHRRVSSDHVVSVDAIHYEMPRGHAGRQVTLHRRLLEGTLHCVHEGRLVQIHEVDFAANATARRGRLNAEPTPPEPKTSLKKRAADLAFDRDFRPVVSEDGGCPPLDPHP